MEKMENKTSKVRKNFKQFRKSVKLMNLKKLSTFSTQNILNSEFKSSFRSKILCPFVFVDLSKGSKANDDS